MQPANLTVMTPRHPSLPHGLPARRIGVPLFGIGLLACGVSGCVGLASVTALTVGTQFWAMAPVVKTICFVIVAFGVLSAPINLVILPLAYAGFRRSAHLRTVLLACGLFGGLMVTLILIAKNWPLPGISGLTVFGVMPATGAAIGLISAGIFLRLLR
ncbi:hypothetical protein [Methylobacterium sp. Leaf456]|uniref:hypothetical protein n=1 Tax=Methylobacterium sp. Leaf456 TaxID=1736382 RepID=UPI0012E3B887|nr:hypothetical protein [Methylobacterium sp. Leaf456]